MDDGIDSRAAQEALGRLEGLREDSLCEMRRRWINHDVSTDKISQFVRSAAERASRAQETVASCDPLTHLVEELDALCEQFDYPIRDSWVEVAGALGELSVLLPEVRAALRQYAECHDLLHNLNVKINEQEAVVAHLTEDLNTVTSSREHHHTAMTRQKKLNTIAKYRWRTEQGKLVKYPGATLATDTPYPADVRQEVIKTLAAQLDRATQRLAMLRQALPDGH